MSCFFMGVPKIYLLPVTVHTYGIHFFCKNLPASLYTCLISFDDKSHESNSLKINSHFLYLKIVRLIKCHPHVKAVTRSMWLIIFPRLAFYKFKAVFFRNYFRQIVHIFICHLSDTTLSFTPAASGIRRTPRIPEHSPRAVPWGLSEGRLPEPKCLPRFR